MILAHVSRSVTVLLKTIVFSAVVCSPRQKYPSRSNWNVSPSLASLRLGSPTALSHLISEFGLICSRKFSALAGSSALKSLSIKLTSIDCPKVADTQCIIPFIFLPSEVFPPPDCASYLQCSSIKLPLLSLTTSSQVIAYP